MQTQIVNARRPLLKQFVQSFLFFRSAPGMTIDYTTFPNTNLCLAIYKNNEIDYFKNGVLNKCELNSGRKPYQSRLYGFHQSPFQVRINGEVDQVCILFHPGALKAFTNEPYEMLLQLNNPFEAIFPSADAFFPELLFHQKNHLERINMLEDFLEKQLIKTKLSAKIEEAIYMANATDGMNLSVDGMAKKLKINPSTLYRLFSAEIGQSPKSFLQTVRFRKALNHLNELKKPRFSHIAYLNNYYDQAHFIKDLKALAGVTPSHLKKNISMEQGQLIWLYHNDSE